MPKFLLMATVDFQASPDYPKTPAQEKKWRVGIIQSVLSDVIQVWYRENGVEKQAKFMVNQPRPDARDEAKEERALPFVGPPECIGSDPFVNVIYGGSSRYPFYDDISDGSTCARTGAVRDLTS
jgi:hypothetical protein